MQQNANHEASKKDCKACCSLLFPYAMDEASAQEKAWVDSHLKTCFTCQQEYQKVKAIALALRPDEVPELPADFSHTLHQKLIAVAKEKKPSAFSKWMEKLKNAGVFRVGVPALACLCLVVGVFSSGLFDRWMNPALEVEPLPSAVSSVPVAEEDAAAVPDVTLEPETEKIAPIKTAQSVAPGKEEAAPAPVENEQEAAPVTEAAEEEPVQDEAAPMIAKETENVPMMAVYEEEVDEAALAVERAQLDSLTTEDGASGSSSGAYSLRETAVSYLDALQSQLPFSWESRAIEIAENRVVLELSYEEWDAFSTVASGIVLEKNEETERVTVAVER